MKKTIILIVCALFSAASLAFIAPVEERIDYTKNGPCDDPNVVYMFNHLPEGCTVRVEKYKNDFNVYSIAKPITTHNGISWYTVVHLYPRNPKDESTTIETHFFESCESTCICAKFKEASYGHLLYMSKASEPTLKHYDERFVQVKNVTPGTFLKIMDSWAEKVKQRDFSDRLLSASDPWHSAYFKDELASADNNLRVISIELTQWDGPYYYELEIAGKKHWSITFDIVDGKLICKGISSITY